MNAIEQRLEQEPQRSREALQSFQGQINDAMQERKMDTRELRDSVYDLAESWNKLETRGETQLAQQMPLGGVRTDNGQPVGVFTGGFECEGGPSGWLWRRISWI